MLVTVVAASASSHLRPHEEWHELVLEMNSAGVIAVSGDERILLPLLADVGSQGIMNGIYDWLQGD
jgi:hypothetical protein